MATGFPVRKDFIDDAAIPQGAYWAKNLALRDRAGTLWDTTGFSGVMKIRRTIEGTALVTLTTANGRLLTGIRGDAPHQYCIGIRLYDDELVGVSDWGIGVYDLYVTDLAGRPHRILHGLVAMSRKVSY